MQTNSLKLNQSDNIIDELKNLVEQIDLGYLNSSLIKSNLSKLKKTYLELKKIWDKFDEIEFEEGSIQLDGSNLDKKSKPINVINFIKSSFLYQNSVIKRKIKHSDKIFYFKYNNIYFYWIGSTNTNNLIETKESDYLLAKKMFKITVCLNMFRYSLEDTVDRIIIWIPVESSRNFVYDKITKTNLKDASEGFEAFVASGVTWSTSQNKRITIITRYEEVEKLLIHELVHNYHIDGSNYHESFENLINRYRLIKNPSPNPNSDIDKKINFDYEFSIYESYTELLSTYFYLIFSNLESDVILTDITDRLFGQILVEILYSYNTIANLIKLNEYSNYDEFVEKQIFSGDICMYEYYYIKGLMYNNFELNNNFGLLTEQEEFISIYENIIMMIEQIKVNEDKLLKEIYNYSKSQKNFKYQIH
jgi:hypothetical protein